MELQMLSMMGEELLMNAQCALSINVPKVVVARKKYSNEQTPQLSGAGT